MLVFCWNPDVSVLLVLVWRPLVPRPQYFLCRVGGIAKSCCRDFSSGCFSCARDLFRSTLIANLSWNVPASFQERFENVMTAFSLTTRDIVEATHLDATAFIGTHSSLDEAGPTMGTSYTCIEQKNLAKISHVLLRSGKKLSTDFTGIDDENLERFPRKHVRVLVHMSNHTSALRLQSQTLQT